MPEHHDLLMTEVLPIVNGMGFELVELRIGHSTHQSHVFVCIYHRDGVGINDCAALARTLKPMLELHEWLKDLRLEVSSPGVSRTLKRQEEYSIFEGRGIKLKVNDDWMVGIISGTTESELILQQGADQKTVPFDEIKKAKLDYSQEE